MDTVLQTLNMLPDTKVEMIDSGCCGMAGSFGYHKETESVSRQMAALDLVPAIESSATDTIIVADGTSCRHQIADCTTRGAQHVVQVLRSSLAVAPT
jgi:Fe-S oxidoreductase